MTPHAFFKAALRSTIAASLLIGAATAHAADWPTDKPITYLVPFPAGGSTDVISRVLGKEVGDALGTRFVVENRAGAGGSIGTAQAARAAADGSTIVAGTISSQAINVSLYKDIGYDPIKSFTPIAFVGNGPLVLVVPKESPLKTLQDVVKAAQAKPETLTVASSGAGTSQHMTMELLAARAKVKFIHVPYKGNAPAIQDVMSGQVDMMFDTLVNSYQHIQSGRLRALAVTSPARAELFPDVPTFAESGIAGLKDFESSSWQAVFAPAGTPDDRVQVLHKAFAAALAEPEMIKRLRAMSVEPQAMSLQEIKDFQAKEVQRWGDLIRENNIRME